MAEIALPGHEETRWEWSSRKEFITEFDLSVSAVAAVPARGIEWRAYIR